MKLLQVKDLSKSFATGSGPLEVLSGVSFDVAAGESVAITGPSGSGKSTLLSLLAGLEAPTRGSVAIAGQDLALLDEGKLARYRGKHVGIVFQSFRLLPTLNALENVQVPLELGGHADAAKRASDWLTRVGMQARLGHLPSRLSGGEQQRVAIARALASEPALVLADEPTGNLDSANGKLVMDLLFKLVKDAKAALVLITHDVKLARRAGRTLAMRDGHMTRKGAR